MSEISFFDEINSLITDGNTGEALNKLNNHTKEMRCLNQVILLKSRWNSNEKNWLEKEITSEYYEVTKRRVNKAVRELNNSLKNGDWETKPYEDWK